MEYKRKEQDSIIQKCSTYEIISISWHAPERRDWPAALGETNK